MGILDKVKGAIQTYFDWGNSISGEKYNPKTGQNEITYSANIPGVSTAGGLIKSTVTKALEKITPTAKNIITKVTSTAIANPGKTALAVTAGTVIAKSSKAKEEIGSAVVSAPSSFNQFTSNVAFAIDNPSKENIIKIGTDNPYMAGGTALLAGGIFAKSAMGVYSAYETRQNTNAIVQGNNLLKSSMDNITYVPDVDTESSSKIAEINADTQLKIAKLTAEEKEKERKYNLKSQELALAIAQEQSKQSEKVATPPTTPIVSETPKKKATTKKKKTTKKKTKKKVTKKKRSTKKKSTKKKTKR